MFDPNNVGMRDTGIADELAQFLDDGQPKTSVAEDWRQVVQTLSAAKTRIDQDVHAFSQRIQHAINLLGSNP